MELHVPRPEDVGASWNTSTNISAKPAIVLVPGGGGGVYVTGVPTAGVKATLIEMRAPSPGSMMPLGIGTGVLVPARTSMKLRV
jgi:hypothetical protein